MRRFNDISAEELHELDDYGPVSWCDCIKDWIYDYSICDQFVSPEKYNAQDKKYAI